MNASSQSFMFSLLLPMRSDRIRIAIRLACNRTLLTTLLSSEGVDIDGRPKISHRGGQTSLYRAPSLRLLQAVPPRLGLTVKSAWTVRLSQVESGLGGG